jgi:hypothetical protein
MVLSRGAALHSDHQKVNGISETRRRHFVAVCATLCKVLDLCNKGIKSRGMRWAGHVARVRHVRDVCRVLLVDLKEGDHLKDLRVNGKTILKLVFMKWVSGIDWIDLA